MRSKTIETILIYMVISLIGLGLLIFYNYLVTQQRVDKGCGDEYTIFTSKTFRGPEGKPFVHMSVTGKTASAICCAKE